MDLAVYMIVATFFVFLTIAALALTWSVAAGQWKNSSAAANIVLGIDDPYPGEEDSTPDEEIGA